MLLREEAYDLIYNNKTVACLHCMPTHLEELAVGHLFTSGVLHNASEITSLRIQHPLPPQQGRRVAGSIRVTTVSAPLAEDAAKEAQVLLTADEVHRLQADFEKRCTLFRQTGAAHSCALATARGILLFYEDIARHNALDKLIGAMQLQGVSPQGKLMIFSGRLAVDMLEKAVASCVRLLIAPGAPSLASVELAEARQVSLLGFVRKDNINIYTCPHRIA